MLRAEDGTPAFVFCSIKRIRAVPRRPPARNSCTLCAVGQHRLVELRRLLDSRGRALPSRAEEVAWLGSLLEVLTACRVLSRWHRACVRCETAGCSGPVAVRRIGDACEWFCAGCSCGGAIVGWRGTPWD